MKDTARHDLTLGKWGPYNKEYLGVCHIANETLGATFNVELFPALYRREIFATSAMCDGAVKMWGANPERTAFVYRYEMLWKDKLYCDVSFNIQNDECVRIDCDFVNATAEPQSVNALLCAGFEYPTKKAGAAFMGYAERTDVRLPEGCLFIDAPDYESISCAEKLASDGKYLGEVEVSGAAGYGTVVGGEHFYGKEHFIKYKLAAPCVSDTVGIRYRARENTEIYISTDGAETAFPLERTDGFGYRVLDFDRRDVSEITVRASGVAVDIDCIIVGTGAARAEFYPAKRRFEPVKRELSEHSLTLKYADGELNYRIEWEGEPLMIRRLYTDDVGAFLTKLIHDHVSLERRDGGEPCGVFENIITAPLYLDAHSEKRISFIVSCFKDGESVRPSAPCENKLYRVKTNSDGERYAFSQNMMAYNLLLNVVYPIYTRRGYIRHSTPGRIWNSLYTWDSGFIGIGLSTVDYRCAYENLRAYLNPVGDIHSPYIFHGSVVPTQIFLYLELINKCPERHAELKSLYPEVMQYYGFFSRLSDGAEQMKSGVLKTWHIFYNSGGWDDYPPQDYVLNEAGHTVRHSSTTAPAITTSLAVLIAKIMKNISHVFGITENDALFDRDIERYSSAIQKYLWDEDAGYYSYLVHGEDGEPKGFLRYSDGTNYNCGLDGVYPYIAGISDGPQSEKILDNIKNGLMTEYGISAVDTRAPYYSESGYWNGSVWFPHQWILMRALLDRGESALAVKIAKTALSVWKREVERSYSCFEHVMIKNGRGAGFHQFSGLSSPVLSMFETLYTPGTVTGGFSVAVRRSEWNAKKSRADIALVADCDTAEVVICLSDRYEYAFELNGRAVKAKRVSQGAYAIKLGTVGEICLSVTPLNK